MRVELGWYDEAAAEMFAIVVFVSDGLLQINDTTPSPAARFFSIVTQLPLELQMVLCYRVVGSVKEIIPGRDSEVAFKSLAEYLLWSSILNEAACLPQSLLGADFFILEFLFVCLFVCDSARNRSATLLFFSSSPPPPPPPSFAPALDLQKRILLAMKPTQRHQLAVSFPFSR